MKTLAGDEFVVDFSADGEGGYEAVRADLEPGQYDLELRLRGINLMGSTFRLRKTFDGARRVVVQLSPKIYDVAALGGGSAGSAAGIHLKDGGYPVLMWRFSL